MLKLLATDSSSSNVIAQESHPHRSGWLGVFGLSLIWPFRSGRVWMLVFPAAALLLLPYVGILLARGWRVEVVRRIVTHPDDPSPMPDLAVLPRVLYHGAMLFLMTVIYTVPFLIVAKILGLAPLMMAWELLNLLWQLASGRTVANTISEITQLLGTALVRTGAIVGLYYFTIWTWYRCAMIRYSVEGRVGCFFDVWRNTVLVVRHLGDFVVVVGLWVVLNFVLFWFAVILAATGLGVVLIPPVVMLASITSSGYLFGHLAQRMGLAGIQHYTA